MLGKICASIATENVAEIREDAAKALAAGADYLEIRFDFLRSEELENAITALTQFKSKSVFTLRSKKQGGKFAGSEQDRLEWLRKLVQQRPMFVDIELETLREYDELADYVDSRKTPILVSWHDFEKTPSDSDIADLLSEMRVYSNFVKLVTMARSTDDSFRLLDLYETITDISPIIFAMGEFGIMSRVLCTLVGNAPFTYASLGNKVAPGQLTVKQMRRLYDRLAKRSTSKPP